MKRNLIMNLLTAGLVASVLAGCGAKDAIVQTEQAAVVLPGESGEEKPEDDNYEPPTQDLSWIPEGVTLKQSETTKDADIEKIIQEYYEIPDDLLSDTRYYYNLVDLDQNGKDEYFVVVFGSYVSGTGGGSALWLDEEKNIRQVFHSVNTPIIIEDKIENEFQTMIMQISGGGSETEYVRLICDGELYIKPEDCEVIADLDGVTGTAIIANDIVQELYDENYMTLK